MDCFLLKKQAIGALYAIFSLLFSIAAMAAWQETGEVGHTTIALSGQPNEISIATQARVAVVGIDDPAAVTFFNPDTGAIVKTVALPAKPVALAIDPIASKLYALLSGQTTVSVVDINQGLVVATFNVGGTPKALAINPSRPELLVVDIGKKRIVGVDTSTGQILRQKTLTIAPSRLAIARSGARIMIASSAGEMQVLDGNTLSITSATSLGAEVRGLSWWEQGGLAIAVQKTTDALSLVDIDLGLAVSVLPIDGDPVITAVDNVASKSYVSTQGDVSVNRVDLLAKKVEGRYLLPSLSGSIAFDAATSNVLITLPKKTAVLKLDPNAAPLLGRLQLNKSLQQLVVNNVTQEFVTIASKTNQLSRVRLATGETSTLQLSTPPTSIGVDTGLNQSVYADGQTIKFISLNPGVLNPSESSVNLGKDIVDLAVDSVHHITLVITKGAGTDDIHLVDNANQVKLATLNISGSLNSVAINPSAGIGYITTDNKKILKVDLIGRTISQAVFSNRLDPIAYVPGFNVLVVGDQIADVVRIVDAVTLGEIRSFAVPRHPSGFAVQSDSSIVAVLSKVSDQVSILDLNANTLVTDWLAINSPLNADTSIKYNQALVLSAEHDEVTLLPLPSLPPVIATISPSPLQGGGAAKTITITGTHFVNSSVASWAGTALTTTWLSPNQLSALVPSTLLTKAGSFGVQVTTPSPGGGSSNIRNVTVATVFPQVGIDSPPSGSTIYRDDLATVRFHVSESGGLIRRVEYTLTAPDGTQRSDVLQLTEDGNMVFTFTPSQLGTYQLTLTATDRAGAKASSTLLLAVGLNEFDANIVSTWNTLASALSSGNVAQALTLVSGGSQDKYTDAFSALGPDIKEVFATTSELHRGTVTDSLAEYVVLQKNPETGRNEAFFIYFIKETDGVWRLDSM